MADVTYEGMFLLDSNKFAANPNGLTNDVHGLIERVGGKILASRPWQDSKLCYPINKHRKGMYFLTYFSIDSRKLTELDRLVKFNEAVLRHITIKLDPALVEPMLANLGKGAVVSTFKDSDAEPEVAVAAVAAG